MSQSAQQTAKRATIKDVALAAGVSVTTVSNVLNNRTDAMTAETLRRIQETMLALNYRPSQVARSLVTSQTATIGLIISEIETPLFLQTFHYVEPIAREAGYSLLLGNARNLEEEEQTINLLLEKQVDGIIFLSNSTHINDDYLDQLPDPAPPIVLVNRTTIHQKHDQINWDNIGGVVAGINYLAKQGHRLIAQLTGPANRHSTTERIEGFKQGLLQHNLEYCPEYVVKADYEQSQHLWAEATMKLLNLSPRPTAILASNDTVAAVVLRTVQRAGLKIPDDITVIGNDNQPFCTFLNPTLTTIQLPIIESGQRAIYLLLARLTGERTTPEHLVLPCPLIVRESSGAAPQG